MVRVAMNRRLFLGLLLVAALLSLRSAVFACGIEETWIPGIYDGGDTDDALALAGFKALEAVASPVASASSPSPAAPRPSSSRSSP
jgi:hypothetical protein